MTIYKFIVYTIVLAAMLPGPACKKNNDLEYQPTDSLGKLNKWVYDSMKLYYYWSADMPAHPDYSLATQDFFRSLLSPSDRFSWASNRSNITQPKTSSELYGFHYALAVHPFNAQQLVGVVTCVVPGSNADNLGLKRGMLFTSVNNKVITPDTRQSTNEALRAASAILQLAAFTSDRSALTDSARVGVQSGYVPPKSVYATRVFERAGFKTGYLAYYLCDENNDGLLVQALQKLKNSGVTECILDLRYNPGGSVASATKLAATLMNSFNIGGRFITYRGNKHGGTVLQTFEQAIAYSGNANGKDKATLQALHLGLQRLYILTSPVTASAAELLTHNLDNWQQVVRIGETTLGKDEAAFPIEDLRNPRQVNWLLMPIVYKIADGLGRGDYASGLTPHYPITETSVLPLSPIGQPGDLPVDQALRLIYNSTDVSVTNL